MEQTENTKMATTTTTLTEEVPVEVTNNVASEQNEPKESSSAFARLRRRFTKDKSDSQSKRPSGDYSLPRYVHVGHRAVQLAVYDNEYY